MRGAGGGDPRDGPLLGKKKPASRRARLNLIRSEESASRAAQEEAADLKVRVAAAQQRADTLQDRLSHVADRFQRQVRIFWEEFSFRDFDTWFLDRIAL